MSDARAQELHDPRHASALQDGEGHRGAKPCLRGQLRSREVGALGEVGEVGDPGRGPGGRPDRKTLAGRERHLRAGDGEVGDSEALCGPGIDQPEHPWVPVPSPDLAELPAEGPADGFEESRCRQGERCRLGQHPSDGVLDHEPQPGPRAAAHLGPRGPPIGGRSRGVGLSVARAAYRLLRLGRAFLRVPQACFALPLTCWAPPMISWLGFSEARPTFLLNRTP